MALKLLINSFFRGGAEKQFAALAGLLPTEAVFLLEDETAGAPPSVPVKALSRHTSRTSPLLKTAAIPLYASRLAAAAGRGDTVLSFMERSNIVNVIAGRAGGHRSVICERTRPSGEFSGLRGALMRPLIRRYYPLADIVVANSAGVKKDLTDNFGVPADKIRVIHNGCDAAGIAALAAKPLPEGWDTVYARPVLATSGRLTAAKGQWHLLRIFKALKQEVPAAALVLVGDGELRGMLTRLAVRLGLKVSASGDPDPQADVYFAGFRENPYPFLAKARLFVFTSLWEGFPNALVEAMACGVPVVAADCAAGPREILDPLSVPGGGTAIPETAPYGTLMPVLSGFRLGTDPLEPEETAWAETLSKLISDVPALERFSAAGLKRAADFGLARAAARWRELLGC
ncbi:MAG: glycosyltransferase [Elusimicrobia bacterium]|nr:glycosyltransferase [Elusimicrobiota bacterium]